MSWGSSLVKNLDALYLVDVCSLAAGAHSFMHTRSGDAARSARIFQ